MSPSEDIIDCLLSSDAKVALTALREERPAVKAAAQESFDVLFEPGDTSYLSRIERESCALRVALSHDSDELVKFYASRLRQLDGGEASIQAPPPRLAAMFEFADRMTLQPGEVGAPDLDALKAAGLTTVAIVTLSQLIAFVAYQVRALHGLALLGEVA